MAQVLQSPEDICNAAIAQLGWPRRIGSLYDGSAASKIFLDIYSHTRDVKLREFEWGLAERTAPLDLLKTAPVGGYTAATPWTSAYPAPGWIFEYAYPTDCVMIRSLRTNVAFVPNFDPRPSLFRIANDTIAGTQQKVILSNLASALAVYTGQVTDPSLWEPGFAEALVDALAMKVQANPEARKLAIQEDAMESQGAEMRLG